MDGENVGQAWYELSARDEKLREKLREVDALIANTGKKAETALSDSLSRTLTNVGGSLEKAGKTLSSAGSTLSIGLTAPLVAAGAAASKFGLAYDTTMRQIQGLAKVPASEIASVREEILKLGPAVGRSPQELANAFYFVASAGFKADEAMKVLEISAKASAAGMGQTSDIAKVLGSVLNAYGHDNITAAHAADILTAAVQDGSAEASDFATALGNVVPTAATMGVTFDQVTAAMAGMTNVGIDAATAAVNLNQILSSLIKPTSEADDALASVGLSAAGLRQELRDKGLLATLRTLEEAFKGNDTAIASVFGNIRALRGVDALLSLDQEQLNGIFNDTSTALGNLTDAYDATDGPQRRFDRSIASIQASAIRLGSVVGPMVAGALNQIANLVAGIAEWFDRLPKPIQGGIVQLAALAAAIGPVLLVGGKLLTMFGLLFKTLGWLTGTGPGSLGALLVKLPLIGPAAASALGPLGLVIAAMATLNDLNKQIAQGTNLGQSLKDAQDLAKAAGRTIGEVNDWIKKTAATTGESLVTIRDALIAELAQGQGWDQATAAVKDRFASGIDAATAAALAAAGDIDRKVADVVEQDKQQVADAARDMADGIPKALVDAKNAAKDVAIHTPFEIAQSFDEGRDAVYQAALGLGAQQTRAQDLTNQIVQKQAELASSELAKQLKSKDKATRAAAQSQVNQLKHEIFALQAELDPKAALASKTLADALQSEDPETKRWAQALADSLQQEIIAQLPATQQAADYLGALMPDALKYGLDSVRNAAEAQATALRTGLERAKGEATRTGLQAGESFGDGVADPSNGTHAADAGFQIASDVHNGFAGNPWYAWGAATSQAWIDGLIASMNAANKARLNSALNGLTGPLRGYSPPKEGPLHPIDVWGANIGSAWVDGLMRAIGTVADRLANPLAALAPALGGGPQPAAQPAGGGGGTVVNNYFQPSLTVDGFLTQTPNDAVNALSMLGRFSEGSLSGA